MNKWVSVNDGLPLASGYYLCIVKKLGIRIMQFAPWEYGSHQRWWSRGSETKNVTHWMPLPKIPK